MTWKNDDFGNAGLPDPSGDLPPGRGPDTGPEGAGAEGAEGTEDTEGTEAAGDDRATIYDVAKLAGVAPSTVSRTFSRPDRVSSRTSEKVLAAARELGYRTAAEIRPDRPVGHPRSNVLGLVVADIVNPFFQELMLGAAPADHRRRCRRRRRRHPQRP